MAFSFIIIQNRTFRMPFFKINSLQMKRLLLAAAFLPLIGFSQSKKQKQKEQEANAIIVNNLKAHVQTLADDKMEGRRAGTKGEEAAMGYIINQFQQIGLEPKGEASYIQEFTIDEGKQITEATNCTVNNQKLELNKDYFPLGYSACLKVTGNAALALNEAKQPWFIDIKDLLEENQTNPHFDIDEMIKKEAGKAAAKKATALFIYNSGKSVDNIVFNKNDKSEPLKIPVLYLTKSGVKNHFPDYSATQSIELNVVMVPKVRKAHNLVGFINNNAAATVVIGAHYDHLGFGEDKNALDTGNVIHNGADDNASGTAALIELAKMLRKSSFKNNNYLFISFSGEELGLLGSKYWIENATDKASLNYMINMDMVGRYEEDRKLIIGGFGTSSTWGDVLATVTHKDLVVKFDSTGSGPSDHATFYRAGIPVLFFFTGSHQDYHKATDDWDKLNYESEKDIVQYIYKIIGATDSKNRLVFSKTNDPQMTSMKFTVSLGVMPDYGFTGTGVKIDGISPGKLAERTGLQAGDILTQLGEYKFVDVSGYMQVLSKFKKGDKTTLHIKREGTEKAFDIEF